MKRLTPRAWSSEIVRSNPPRAEDFRSHLELGKKPKAPRCLRAGLSVFRQRADAEHMAGLFKVLGGFIAEGVLAPRHGKTKLTGHDSHTTWWTCEAVDRLSLFAKTLEG